MSCTKPAWMRSIVSLLVWLAFPGLLLAQEIYKDGVVTDIRLYIKQKNWDSILDSLKQAGKDERLVADVLINGVRYKGVGLRYKGNSSYFSVRKSGARKLPLNIKINYTDKSLSLPGGYTSLKLANSFRDPSFLREILAYDIARQYMAAPQANFARVYVNDVLLGLYHNTESIDEPLLRRYFDDGKGTLIKCDPADWNVRTPEGCPKSDHASLQYLGDSALCYRHIYELEQGDYEHLISFTRTLGQSPEQLEQVLNIDQTLWMLAFNNVLVNLDSYLGKFCHNYYLYRDSSGMYHPLVWDLNMSFGGFRFSGAEDGALTDEKLQTLSPFLHYREKSAERPLIAQLLAQELWRKVYIAHIRTMLQEQFVGESYLKRARVMQQMIDPMVKADTNRLYDYAGFRANLDSTARADKSNIIGIAQLMRARVSYLLEHPLLKREPPRVGLVKHVVREGRVEVTAPVTAAVQVWLLYRVGRTGPFVRLPMVRGAGDVWTLSMPWQQGLVYYLVAEDERSAAVYPARGAMSALPVGP
jgi:hypothetical protein